MKANRFLTTLTIVLALGIPSSSWAARVWSGLMPNWTVMINNGVAYVTAPAMPTNCLYQRAQINLGTDQLSKSLYAMVLGAYLANKPTIRIVIDDATTTCVMDAVNFN